MSWQIDPAHSQITFSARHLMISNVRGRFENFTGIVALDEENPARTTVDVQIAAASINTREEKRDDHLRSPDFLNAAQFPALTFKSRRVQVTDETHARLLGDLTIRDVTKPVTLDVEYAGQAKTPWGSTSAGFSASTKISRKDWGLTWNVSLEPGGWLVSDEIAINIELELMKQADEVEEGEAVLA